MINSSYNRGSLIKQHWPMLWPYSSIDVKILETFKDDMFVYLFNSSIDPYAFKTFYLYSVKHNKILAFNTGSKIFDIKAWFKIIK